MSEAALQKLKPPLWASRLRRILGRTCVPVGIVAYMLSIPLPFIGAPSNGRQNSWTEVMLVLTLLVGCGAIYSIGGLLFRLFLPSLLQFSLGGLLGTIVTLGACVCAWISPSVDTRFYGTVLFVVGLCVGGYISAQNDARYDWPEK